jgi:cytochrome d ubiquinol oxidase subunit I
MTFAVAERIIFAPADPSQLLPAREQMAFTLGFHILLVPFGVAFTFLMLLAEFRGIRRSDEVALLLARRWSQVAVVLFAVGAVSGTVLSFELGLLWPGLMGRFGAAYGIPFAVEGLFFFLEAIFISIYIYGWQRLRPWPHFWTGAPVVLSGIGGTASVVAANAWMNEPAGFTLAGGQVVAVQPLRVFFNGAFWFETLHMLLAAYMVAGFLVAGVYAVGLLRGRHDRYHRLGLTVPLTVAGIASPLQVFVGDLAAREVFAREPAKFAAIEELPRTGTHVPEVLGGVLQDGQVHGGLPIPSVASLLSGLSPGTRIRGLDAIPASVQPPEDLVTVVHLSFDLMVAIGVALLALSAWYALVWWRRRDLPGSPWFLRAVAISGLLAVAALEAGWVVTEVGRQPWTVVGYLLTRDAVTRSGNLWAFFCGVLVLYAVVGWATFRVLGLLRRRWREAGGSVAPTDVPYGPTGSGQDAAPRSQGEGSARRR